MFDFHTEPRVGDIANSRSEVRHVIAEKGDCLLLELKLYG